MTGVNEALEALGSGSTARYAPVGSCTFQNTENAAPSGSVLPSADTNTVERGAGPSKGRFCRVKG
jgi:hypothetical protein